LFRALHKAVRSTSHVSPEEDVTEAIRSLVWQKAARLLVQIDTHSDSTSPEGSGLPVGVKAWLAEGTNKNK